MSLVDQVGKISLRNFILFVILPIFSVFYFIYVKFLGKVSFGKLYLLLIYLVVSYDFFNWVDSSLERLLRLLDWGITGTC